MIKNYVIAFFFRSVVIFIMIFLSSTLSAQPLIDTLIIKSTEEYELNKYLYFFKTKEQKTSEQIFDFSNQQTFDRLFPQKSFNVGVTNEYYWFIFRVKNTLQRDIILFFQLNNPGINVAKIYQKEKDGFSLIGQAGDHLPFNTRPFKYYDLVFPFHLDEGETKTILAMLDNSGDNLDCLPQLLDINTFNEKVERYYSVVSIITGIMLTAFILNLFLAISLRDKLHLLYSFYILSMLFEMYLLQGLDVQYIYPGNPVLSDIFKYLSPAIGLTLMAFVMQLFLKQTRKNSRLHLLVDLLKYFIIALIPIYLAIYFYFPDSRSIRGIYQQVFALSLALQLFLFLLSALEKVIQRYKPAYFYLAAIVYLWFGAIQYVISIMGGNVKELIEKQPNDLQIGIVAETIIVFLGIIYRYNLFKKENQVLSLTLKNEKIKFTEQVISIQESERKRIAEDLHDELGSSLAALKLKLQKINLPNIELKDILYTIDKASDDTRSIAHNLMPPEFEKTPLHNLLSSYYSKLNTETSIRFTFHSSGNNHYFSKEEELVVYRILMELTNNILKHSDATDATIQLIYYEDHLELMAEDNGKGIIQQGGDGIGLKNTRSRVNYLNGSLQIDSNNGTTIMIQIPYKNK